MWEALERRTETRPGDPAAARLLDRTETRWEVGPAEDLGGGLRLERRVCDRGAYRRCVYTLTAERPVTVGTVTLFADEPGTRCGTADGAVAVRPGGTGFVAAEHPMAKLAEKDGRLTATLPCGATLAPGERLTFATVEGKARPGQLRRDFQAYLEEVRAHPYRVLPHYNAWYHLGIATHTNPDPLKRMTAARCLQMIADYDMNLFKFDGIGGGVWALGTDAKTAPDLRGLFTHIEALRRAKPDLFVNCTVGTWPSPFWTLWADSIWRGGGDWGQAGPGPRRERWITYRDSVVHDRLARGNPLYPLNSVMLHGVIVAKQFGMAVGDDPARHPHPRPLRGAPHRAPPLRGGAPARPPAALARRRQKRA